MEPTANEHMTSMNVSLPQSLREFAETRSRSGYSSASEYIRELIRNDQKRVEQERLDSMLLAGLESGHVAEVSPEYFARKKAELSERAPRKR